MTRGPFWATLPCVRRSFATILAVTTLACGGAAVDARPEPTPQPKKGATTSVAAPPAPETVQVRLIAFNDFHGHLKPPNGHVPKVSGEVGGAAWFAAHLKRLGAGQPNAIVVAAGDLVGASPLTSALFHDEPTIDVMNAIGLSTTAIGNHEFDEGPEELLRLRKGGCHPKDGCKYTPSFAGAKFEMLGANVSSSKSDPKPFPPYVIREVLGVPIGFVGMPLEDTPHSVVPEGVVGLSFADEVKTANALVPELRAKGVETMILLVHQGGEVSSPGLDECNNLKGAIVPIAEKLDKAYDAIISGHTHQLYNCKVAGRPVTSAHAFGRVITTIDLTIDKKTHDVVRSEAHNHAVTHDIPPDPEVQKIVDQASAVAAPIENRVVGRITETLSAGARGGGESILGDVIADAHLEATKKAGAKVALVNASGVRTDILFAKSGDEPEDGIVTHGEAFAAQPFGNALVTVTITGEELLGVLERELKDGSGVMVSAGLSFSVGGGGSKRVHDVKLNGRPLDPKANVRVTTNSFVASRDPALKAGRDRAPGPGDLEALEAYFAKHPKVTPPKLRRIQRD